MTGEARGLKAGGTCSKRLQEMEEGVKKVEMEHREEGPGGGCNLVGGSGISLQQCHRHKHTNQHLWMTVASERRSVWGKYSVATGTNTYCPNEVSDNTAYNKLYTVYCMV